MRLGLSLGLSRAGGGGATFDETGMSLTPTHWIDDVGGSDSNDGLSEGAAWASLNKIETISGASDAVVRVKAGTYDKAGDHVEVNGFASHLQVVFESGCTIDGTVNGDTAQNPIYAGDIATTMTIYGNGLAVQNFSGLTGGTPNAFGYGGTGTTLTVYDASGSNCSDGISGHGAAHGEFHRVIIAGNMNKATIANVDTSTMNAYNCSFTANSAATNFSVCSAGRQYFENCALIPTATRNDILGENQEFQNCQLGTAAASVVIQGRTAISPATSILVEDSYVNANMQALPRTTFRRCYGKFAARNRSFTGQTFTVENCVFSAAATGGSGIVYSNFNPGGGIKWVFRNNIIETATAAAFMTLDATNAGFMVSEASEFFNNILSGSAAFDADLVSADAGGTVIVDNVTADALIGAANTLDPDDYGYTAGSPAIGSATGGGNCGFAVGDVVAPEFAA